MKIDGDFREGEESEWGGVRSKQKEAVHIGQNFSFNNYPGIRK